MHNNKDFQKETFLTVLAVCVIRAFFLGTLYIFKEQCSELQMLRN